ncbi:MAG: DUF5615 family PIN-like protein [Bacteroidota bacterium]
MILADEGLNGNIVSLLRENQLDVDWVLEIEAGLSDEAVIELAKKNNKILITEDKDFGEWVFAHKISGLTIIFLRYEKIDFELIIDFLIDLLNDILKSTNIQESPKYEFITINKNKIRRREI